MIGVINPGSGGSGSAPRRATQLTARGLIEETFQVEGSNQNTFVTDWISGYLVGLTAGDVVSNLSVCIITAAAGTAPTTIRLGLADKTGKVLATTGNLNADAKWTSTGYQSFALTVPGAYTIPTTDGYYVCVVQSGNFGTTNPQILGLSLQVVSQGAVGSGKPSIAGANLTDFPAVNSSITLVTSSASLRGHWLGLS